MFHVVKNLFRHRKCRYKGLAKNTAQLRVLFAMATGAVAANAVRAVQDGCVLRATNRGDEPRNIAGSVIPGRKLNKVRCPEDPNFVEETFGVENPRAVALLSVFLRGGLR